MIRYKQEKFEIGVCCPCNRVEEFSGYDFVELPVTDIMSFDDKSFLDYVSRLKKTQIRVKSVNCLFSKNLKLYYSELDIICNYFRTLVNRVNILGCEKIVFGSGKSRMIPDGVSKEKYDEKFRSILKDILKICEEFNIYFLLEYLSVDTCNFMNSFNDAYEIIKSLNNKRLGIVVDLYHSYYANEDIKDLVKYQEYIKHIHICTKDRNAPGSNSEDFKDVFDSLLQFENKPTVSIEVNDVDMVIKYSSLDYIRKTLNMREA